MYIGHHRAPESLPNVGQCSYHYSVSVFTTYVCRGWDSNTKRKIFQFLHWLRWFLSFFFFWSSRRFLWNSNILHIFFCKKKIIRNQLPGTSYSPLIIFSWFQDKGSERARESNQMTWKVETWYDNRFFAFLIMSLFTRDESW